MDLDFYLEITGNSTEEEDVYDYSEYRNRSESKSFKSIDLYSFKKKTKFHYFMYIYFKLKFY